MRRRWLGYRKSDSINVADGLIAYYSFEDATASTDVIIDSVGTYDATFATVSSSTRPNAITGVYGQGLNFDGNGEYYDTGTNAISGGRTAFTFALWVKFPTIPTSGNGIYLWSSWSNGHICRLLSNGVMSFTTTTSAGRKDLNTPSNTISQVDTWYHVLCEYDGAEMRIFINKALSVSIAQTGTMNFGSSNDLIGILGSYTGPKAMDDLRFYNKILTQSEKDEL